MYQRVFKLKRNVDGVAVEQKARLFIYLWKSRWYRPQSYVCTCGRFHGKKIDVIDCGAEHKEGPIYFLQKCAPSEHTQKGDISDSFQIFQMKLKIEECKFRKTLYRVLKSPRTWYDFWSLDLIDIGLKLVRKAPSIFDSLVLNTNGRLPDCIIQRQVQKIVLYASTRL